MARIAVVDDNVNLLVSVSAALEAEGFEVSTYRNGVSILKEFPKVEPELVVLDVKMPGLGGLEVLEHLRQISQVPVILLSGKATEVDEAIGLRMGADDYVVKPFSQRLLTERISSHLRRQEARLAERGKPRVQSLGEADLEEAEVPRIDHTKLAMDPRSFSVQWRNENVPLTKSEFALVHFLASNPGVLMSRDQLMDVLYADEAGVIDRSIDGHIKRIRAKFRQADEGFSSIETMYGIGYRYTGE
ncbi:response regulator transcription factor [uncultured Limimaricola sp.]|uniref:response regulator transcription factor n=1 Tax=uncultured Limimaricola sp. TaxID=2211667 RepID=UPI0030FA42F2